MLSVQRNLLYIKVFQSFRTPTLKNSSISFAITVFIVRHINYFNMSLKMKKEHLFGTPFNIAFIMSKLYFGGWEGSQLD